MCRQVRLLFVLSVATQIYYPMSLCVCVVSSSAHVTWKRVLVPDEYGKARVCNYASGARGGYCWGEAYEKRAADLTQGPFACARRLEPPEPSSSSFSYQKGGGSLLTFSLAPRANRLRLFWCARGTNRLAVCGCMMQSKGWPKSTLARVSVREHSSLSPPAVVVVTYFSYH